MGFLSRTFASSGEWAFGKYVPCVHRDPRFTETQVYAHQADRQPGVLAYSPRKALLTVLELVAAFVVCRGIADWSFPAALIVGGLAVIVAINLRG